MNQHGLVEQPQPAPEYHLDFGAIASQGAAIGLFLAALGGLWQIRRMRRRERQKQKREGEISN